MTATSAWSDSPQPQIFHRTPINHRLLLYLAVFLQQLEVQGTPLGGDKVVDFPPAPSSSSQTLYPKPPSLSSRSQTLKPSLLAQAVAPKP
jgi:hypothetical protein